MASGTRRSLPRVRKLSSAVVVVEKSLECPSRRSKGRWRAQATNAQRQLTTSAQTNEPQPRAIRRWNDRSNAVEALVREDRRGYGLAFKRANRVSSRTSTSPPTNTGIAHVLASPN